MKRVSDLRKLSDDQIISRLREIDNSLRRARGFNVAAKPQNPMLIIRLKKEKARILTIEREREIARS